MPDRIVVEPVTPRQTIGWRDWSALVVLLGLTLAIWRVDVDAAAAKHASTVNRELGYHNRAAVCDFIREFGGVEPTTCADPVIAPFRDRTIHPGEGERRNTTVLLCRILAALHSTAAQCADGP